ncbi:MAG: hypothetical protein BGO95_05585 [Micrococcales bacterium 73-13]|nr:MAG: hypothetical protein BGO95_05585 [Micrococcales bacterium 73-13]
MALKFQIVKGKSEKQPYFFRIVASNGQTLAVSENYVEKASAKKAVQSIIKSAGDAQIEDLSAK